jgi:hypothetical protein
VIVTTHHAPYTLPVRLAEVNVQAQATVLGPAVLISATRLPMALAALTIISRALRPKLDVYGRVVHLLRGIRSIHHFHNVQCGVASILSFLENNNDVVEKADQLSRRASSYITRHNLISSTARHVAISEDAHRLQAAHAALAGFRLAVEHSRPNARA